MLFVHELFKLFIDSMHMYFISGSNEGEAIQIFGGGDKISALMVLQFILKIFSFHINPRGMGGDNQQNTSK